MKNDRLIPGLILVLIGLVILFDNLGYIDFDWTDILNLWPVFLILVGVNLVFTHTRSPLVTVVKIVVVLCAFLFVLGRYGEFGPKTGMHNHVFWRHYDHDNNDKDDNDHDGDDNDNEGTVIVGRDTASEKPVVNADGSRDFKLAYSTNAKSAELNITGGASDYTLNDTTSQLFYANTKQDLGGKYEFWNHNDGSNYVINFQLKSDKHINLGGDHDNSNKVILKLNPNPIWDINLEMGAVAMNFDLSKFKIERLKVDGLAGSFDIKLGEPLETTNIKLATGAASNDISIPKDAACRIESSTFLSSTNYEEQGFQKVDGGWETPNYKSAKNKLNIHMDGLAGSFDIHRY
jgi:hypothetical protein